MQAGYLLTGTIIYCPDKDAWKKESGSEAWERFTEAGPGCLDQL